MNEACKRWARLSDCEALEEPLSLEEQQFLHTHGATCPHCAEEDAVWGALGSMLDAPPPAAQPAPQMAPPISAVVPASAKPRVVHWKRALMWTSAAAALLLAVVATSRLGPTHQAALPKEVTSPLVQHSPRSLVHIVSVRGGSVDVDGRPAQEGARLAEQAVVFARKGIVCLQVPPGVRACLAQGGLLRLADTTVAHRRLELLSGRVVAELDPQPAGTSFGVVTRDGSAVAVGTAFSVEVPSDDGPVITRVSHGTVLVQGQKGHTQHVTAHRQALMEEPSRALPQEDEQRDLDLMTQATAREEPTLAAKKAASQPSAVASAEPLASAQDGLKRAAAVNASMLLARARDCRQTGDLDCAIAAYERLFAQHANTREARTARVAYGETLLSADGKAAAALAAFELYLETEGPLAEEASFGRVRALRALGRRDDERAAAQQFLSRFPSSPLAPALRARAQ